ncbi:MAG: tetratricopeptide repeat protein, partial [Candidatus Hydrogenedentes bacterium]|nr:tetratricopeptide repeat protein [Candidatus Hydrogenedentota bacterium]
YERYDLPEEAAETYAKALKGKRVPDWSLRLAALRYQLGAEDEALATWLSILDGGSSSAAQHAEVAAVLVSHGYLDEAERLYVAAAEKDPANLDYSLKLADLFMSQERFEEALAYHTALAEQDGLEYFRRKGESGQLEAYSALGRIPQVQAEWEAAVEADPESVEAALRVARLYDHVGNRSGAIGIYEKMAGLEPENPSHLVSLTLLYAAARQTGKTIVAYQTLIGIDRNRAASYHRELMRIYQGQNRREEATRSAEQVVALSPASAEARVTLAEIYLMYGRSEEALQQHRSALRLEPEDPSYLRKYGVALASDERWGEAAEAYRKMLAIARGEQTRLDAVQLLASVYLQQGRGQDLAREFSGRVLNTPKRLSAYEELATVYRAIGDLPRAVESIERAIEASEDKETVLRKLLAEAYNAGQLDKVVTAYTQLIDLSGRPTVFELERLGSVYAELGDLRMAQETWERIAEDYPDDPQALVTLANAFRSEGFIEEALGAKERAVELEPYDYPLRFELANDWFAHGEAGKGLAHLERIVELGAPPDEDGESHELSPDMLGLVMGSGRESQSAWNGTFAEFRPRVLTAMVSFGRRGGTIDELFERYRERANARAWDLNLKEDLLDMYEAANRWADAAEVAEELVAARPTDADLLIRTATLYQRSQDLVKAVETMGLLAEARPEEAASQQALLIRMYLTNGDMAKAKERIKALVEDRQDNSSVLLQAAGMLRKTGSPDQVEELYEYIVALDPSLTRRIQMRLVRLYRDKADLDAARRLYGEIIFASERDPNARRRQQEQGFVYTPDVQRGYWDHNITAILGRVNADVDLSRAQAFTDLMSMSLDLKPINTIVERLEALAEQYTQLEPGDEKRYTMEMAKILLAYYTCNEKFEKSLRL